MKPLIIELKSGDRKFIFLNMDVSNLRIETDDRVRTNIFSHPQKFNIYIELVDGFSCESTNTDYETLKYLLTALYESDK